jgi:hypothetical protein
VEPETAPEPLYPGPWSSDGDVGLAALSRLQSGGAWQDDESAPNQNLAAIFASTTFVSAASIALPFYRQIRLVRLTIARGESVRDVYVLDDGATSYWLNGTSDPIHAANESAAGGGALQVDDETVTDYLRFFVWFLTGQADAPFVFIEAMSDVAVSLDDFDLPARLEVIDRLERIRRGVHPIRIVAKTEQPRRWKLSTAIAYQWRFALVEIVVDRQGSVEMTVDHQRTPLDMISVPPRPKLRLLPQLVEQAHARLAALDREHPDSFATRRAIADQLGADGFVLEQVKVLEALARDQTRLLYRDHPETLKTRISLLAKQSGPEATKDIDEDLQQSLGRQFRELLMDQVRRLGFGDSLTLDTRFLEALYYRRVGDLDGATQRLRELARDSEQVDGATHSRTMNVREALAECLRAGGSIDEAKTEFGRLLADRSTALGGDHPETIATRQTLADVDEKLPEYEDDSSGGDSPSASK